jgi:methyl-accepting chemotaxis protein
MGDAPKVTKEVGMKLRLKLMIPPALTALMLVLVLSAALWALGAFKDRSQLSQTAMISEYGRISSLQSQLSDTHIDLYRTMTVINLMGAKQIADIREKRAALLGGMAAQAGKQAAAVSPDDAMSRSLKLFSGQLKVYAKSSDVAIDLSTESPNADAMKKADGDFTTMNKTLGEVIALVQARSTAETAALASTARRDAVMVGLLGLVAAAASIAFAWVNQRRLNANIQTAAQAAGQVAEGRLDIQPHSEETDEIGDLLRALGTMVCQLRGSISSVREASESIRMASAEIATGNLDLSQRTEEAAANLQQAASSMDTLTTTVRQSADAARQANQLASSAAEVAARGGVVVSQVVATMDEINASSKKIADIISVIDGIAFQTNILALNAAVEAARAGEQGRGFAVVAGEVRSLAGRSAEAAKEIKSLIGASVDRVETGSRLVADAGQTMQEIVGSVQRVADIIGEITAASTEQSDGIGQVNTSVVQLDQMTQQNAALVEQGAAAAESLKDQALRLAQVVNMFKLDGDKALAMQAAPGRQQAPVANSRPVTQAPAPVPTLASTPAPKPVAAASASDDEWETF